MEKIRAQILKVAPTSVRVLITGESGTGRVGRAGFAPYNRSSSPFVKVNCAAIPAELIESELFGHEKVHSRAPYSEKEAASNSPMAEHFLANW